MFTRYEKFEKVVLLLAILVVLLDVFYWRP